MDDTDLSILRELFMDHVFRLGGADPRISSGEIGKRLDIANSTVALRLRTWAQTGFLNGYITFPNPGLFGCRIVGQVFETATASARAELTTALRAVPKLAHVFEPGIDPFYWVGYLDRDDSAALHGAVTLGAFQNVTVLLRAHAVTMPPCGYRPTLLDWKIIRASRTRSTMSPTEVARSLRVSYRTVATRLDRLISTKALLFVPRLDFRRTNGSIGFFEVALEPGVSSEEIWPRIQQLYHTILPLAPWNNPGLIWDSAPGDLRFGPYINFFACIASPSNELPGLRLIEGWRGVRGASLFFPNRIWDLADRYDPWIDRMIAQPGN